MTNFNLSWNLMLWGFFCGFMLSVFYFSSLWYSAKLLPKIKNKGTFLFLSFLLRLSLFIAVAVWFAMQGAIQLLCMFLAFVITRYMIVPFLKDKEMKCSKI